MKRDLTGMQFGMVAVLAPAKTIARAGAGGRRRTHAMWHVQCACGVERDVRAEGLVAGKMMSCGCARARHVSETKQRVMAHPTWGAMPEYGVWAGMIQRCTNARTKAFGDYGGRGITVCGRWLESFEAFLADMGTRPSAEHQIDRADNARGYEPENCRWATRLEQAQNKRSNRLLTLGEETLCVAEWARRLGVSESMIDNRIRRGWTVARALSTPRLTSWDRRSGGVSQ